MQRRRMIFNQVSKCSAMRAISLILVSTLFFNNLQSQTYFFPVAGVINSKIVPNAQVDKIDKYKAGMGWLMGLDVHFITDSQVVIKGGISFNQRRFSEHKLSYQDVGFFNQFSLQELSFNMAIGRQLQLSSATKLQLMVGSSYSVALGGTNNQEYWIAEPTFSSGVQDKKIRFGSSENDEFKKSYWAIEPAIGFLLKDQWLSVITYSHGVENIFVNAMRGAKYRYRSFTCTIGYNLYPIITRKRDKQPVSRRAF